MNYFVSVTTATTSSEKTVSVSHPDTGVCIGPGFLDMPGTHELMWEPPSGGRYLVRGKAYIGVRRDSPELLDFALIVDDPEGIPLEMLAQLPRLRMRNADSVFVSKSFPLVPRVAWLCKIRQGSARVESITENYDKTRRSEIMQPEERTFVDWRPPSPRGIESIPLAWNSCVDRAARLHGLIERKRRNGADRVWRRAPAQTIRPRRQEAKAVSRSRTATGGLTLPAFWPSSSRSFAKRRGDSAAKSDDLLTRAAVNNASPASGSAQSATALTAWGVADDVGMSHLYWTTPRQGATKHMFSRDVQKGE
ncbi:MAG: hypothetical protein JSU86_13920 [Phycisphaerales bacterium]|nr:MAG: hypothetical protein JSU86_13920 [Phycisphaerales bacterium]